MIPKGKFVFDFRIGKAMWLEQGTRHLGWYHFRLAYVKAVRDVEPYAVSCREDFKGICIEFYFWLPVYF